MPAALLLLLALAAAQAADTTSGGSRAGNYVVGPKDVVRVTVFNEPELSGAWRVENDGEFSYPFLGRVRAGGLTLSQIDDALTAGLADGYLRDPQVMVDIDEYRSQSVFVIGEVRAPGKYILPGEITLLDALGQAGATTDAAGTDVLILHPTDAGPGWPTLPGQRDAEVSTISLRDIQEGKLSRNITIRDGDTIYVPKAERFFVTGFVRNAGSYPLEPNTNVLQAISTAGGVTERGSNRRLRIVRVLGDTRTEFDASPTDLVQPGDTIVVRQRLL
jgi:polysaccharide export outer membrane protein